MEEFLAIGFWFLAFANFVTSELGIAVVSAVIVIAALGWYWGGFKRRIGPLVKDLERACGELTQRPGAEEFAADFHAFEASVSDNRLIGDA